jgi:Protein of unknown function (DUF3500).
MNDRPTISCPDCDSSLDRRTFVRAIGATALATAAGPGLFSRFAHAAPSDKSDAEGVVGKLYGTLSDEQKKTICFDFDNELRKRINANWLITKPTIGSDFYTKDQQALIDEIVKKVTSADGYERIKKQTQDDHGGLGNYSIALFGTPGSGKCEWELTGRHLTLRADGNSVDKAAFGGPIIYGHGEGDPQKNLFHYQTKAANEVFKSLDAKQAEKALLEKAPSEAHVPLQGDRPRFPGVGVSELSADQKKLVEQTLKSILSPYRTEDVDEVMEILKSSGGIDKLHMAFYQQEDLGSDKEWDIWRVEGPSLVCHFRGAPHVHAYINIGVKA